jgi:SAM-dependent methyltransferase
MINSKTVLKRMLPAPVAAAIKKYRDKAYLSEFTALTTQQAFTKIYEQGAWGQSAAPNSRYFSGTGSHDEAIVQAYVAAVGQFLKGFADKPRVVDLGCGDFNVGRQLRELCGIYVACDIVKPLIDFNREKYKALDVDFRVLDLAKDPLPQADIVFVRQVLQHLSNTNIQLAIPKIAANFKFLVLTEHVPFDASFTHNVDKPSGPDTRLALRSGVVVTSAPFNLKAPEQRQLCAVPEGEGVILTTLYTLR